MYNVSTMKISHPDPELLFPHAGKWVATTLDGKRVIASSKKAELLLKKLEKLKTRKGETALVYVPPLDMHLVM